VPPSICRVNRTRIKICGITRVEDALAAARAGADAIGMVFYKPAPRCITVDRAREILAALPPFVTAVGLFVDAAPDEVLRTTADLGLRHVQLHGRETPETVAALRGRAVIKALRVSPDTLEDKLRTWRHAMARHALSYLCGLVLETGGAPAAGGTGVENDWGLIRELQRQRAFEGLPPVIAAGGLTAGNVGRVVRELRPWAVDVSSGVEITRGEKSAEKIAQFVAEVCRADAE
jgi:phosphoribosylanthranilate isomerase